MKHSLRPALVLLLALSLVTGIAYPLLMLAVGRVAFPAQAAGSLVLRDGKVVGSALIGQPFALPRYFWSRPSATTPMPYNAASSGGSNLGPLNPALADAVKSRIAALRAGGATSDGAIPGDLVTASASGLDPDVSAAAALYQVERVAAARHLAVDKVRALVDAHIQPPQLGFLGKPRVNVLLLNLELDRLTTAP